MRKVRHQWSYPRNEEYNQVICVCKWIILLSKSSRWYNRLFKNRALEGDSSLSHRGLVISWWHNRFETNILTVSSEFMTILLVCPQRVYLPRFSRKTSYTHLNWRVFHLYGVYFLRNLLRASCLSKPNIFSYYFNLLDVFLYSYSSQFTLNFIFLVIMELFFELHDHEGVCHKKFQSKFTSEVYLCIQ